MTDPIADMLTRIRNAQRAQKRFVEIPFSKVKFAIAKILSEQEYLGSVEKSEGMPALIKAELRYNGKTPVISTLNRESTPGHRKYRKTQELPQVLNGYGIAIVSTSQGIMTALEAKQKGIGGELLCTVY